MSFIGGVFLRSILYVTNYISTHPWNDLEGWNDGDDWED